MATELRADVGYEQALRVIGRYLDAEPSYHVGVLEVTDGFTVRSHQSSNRAEGRIQHFPWERLRDLVIFQTAGRGLRRRRQRHSGIWDNFPNGHEDFFRALGHELDVAHATSLSVDEMNDGIAVSYMRPSQADSLSYEKENTVMHRDDIVALLKAAQARRGKRPVAAGG